MIANLLWRVALRALLFSLLASGAVLVSAQMRLRIFYGEPLGEGYIAMPLLIFPLIATGALLGASIGSLARRLSLRAQYSIGLLVAFFTIVTLLPDFSLLQVLYFIITAIISGLIVLLPYRSDGKIESELLALYRNRALILLWARLNIASRYSQTILGITWIVLLPLATASVFAFVFSRILQTSPLDNIPFLTFFLTGLTFWNLFSQSLNNGSSSLTGQLGLMNQVYFPREVLVVVRFFEAMVDALFTFALLLVVNLLLGYPPAPIYILLIPVLLIQSALTLGLMFFIASLSVFIRDIPQFVGVVLQIMFYLTPVFYRAISIPAEFQFLVLPNPLVAIIDAYREIILYYRAPDWITLFYPLLLSMVMLFAGYRYFKRRERYLSDYV